MLDLFLLVILGQAKRDPGIHNFFLLPFAFYPLPFAFSLLPSLGSAWVFMSFPVYHYGCRIKSGMTLMRELYVASL